MKKVTLYLLNLIYLKFCPDKGLLNLKDTVKALFCPLY